MEQVLDFWGLDYVFRRHVGVLQSVKVAVRMQTLVLPFLFFITAVKGAYVQVSHRDFIVFYQNKLTCAKMIH